MHYEERAKDRMVTDEHPGYDARAHWCGEDRYDVDRAERALAETGWEEWGSVKRRLGLDRPNLRRVRAWAEWAGAAWRIVKWLAVFALGVLVGAYAESAVWR